MRMQMSQEKAMQVLIWRVKMEDHTTKWTNENEM